MKKQQFYELIALRHLNNIPVYLGRNNQVDYETWKSFLDELSLIIKEEIYKLDDKFDIEIITDAIYHANVLCDNDKLFKEYFDLNTSLLTFLNNLRAIKTVFKDNWQDFIGDAYRSTMPNSDGPKR